ncbi:MAG: sulfite exporter TauE/SafE family protein [Gaiellaceae bacterium]
MDWQLALAGLVVGTLVGLTGMGGGSLMTPLLIFLFGFNPSVAIGTDILHGAAFKTVGAIRHRTLGTVHARLSLWMFLASAPMSLVGVALATWLKNRYGDTTESLGAQVLGGALLLGGLGLLAKSAVRHTERPDAPFLLENKHRWAAVTIGFFGGLIVGLTSVGTGVFFGLTLLVLFPLRSAIVVGTDIFHAAALLWVAGTGHLVAGNVDLAAVGWLLIGSVPGVLIGSQFTVRLPDRSLRLALATVLIASGAKLVDVPAADFVAIALLALGALLVAWSLTGARRQPART